MLFSRSRNSAVAICIGAAILAAVSGCGSSESSDTSAEAGPVATAETAETTGTAEVQITSPTDGGTVDYPHNVTGTATGLKADQKLWAIVVPGKSKTYHPQSSSFVPEADGKFSVAAYVGAPEPDPDASYELMIAAVDAESDTALKTYLDGANASKKYPGLKELPPGTTPLQTIAIKRKPAG